MIACDALSHEKTREEQRRSHTFKIENPKFLHSKVFLRGLDEATHHRTKKVRESTRPDRWQTSYASCSEDGKGLERLYDDDKEEREKRNLIVVEELPKGGAAMHTLCSFLSKCFPNFKMNEKL